MSDRNRNIDSFQLRDYFERAGKEELEDFLEEGLLDLIENLEQEDFFGTEGFNYRLG